MGAKLPPFDELLVAFSTAHRLLQGLDEFVQFDELPEALLESGPVAGGTHENTERHSGALLDQFVEQFIHRLAATLLGLAARLEAGDPVGTLGQL